MGLLVNCSLDDRRYASPCVSPVCTKCEDNIYWFSLAQQQWLNLTSPRDVCVFPLPVCPKAMTQDLLPSSVFMTRGSPSVEKISSSLASGPKALWISNGLVDSSPVGNPNRRSSLCKKTFATEGSTDTFSNSERTVEELLKPNIRVPIDVRSAVEIGRIRTFRCIS